MRYDITTYINELLYQHERVIIPGFGGFVTERKPAEIQQHGYLMPPSKSIDFNEELDFNDNLLIETIVQNEGITYGEATEKVKEFVQKIETDLKKGTANIGQAGRFYYDIEKQLTFVQSNHNFEADSFGLPKVQFFPIIQRSEAPIILPTAPDPNTKQSALFTGVAKLWTDKSLRYIVLIVLALIFLMPLLFRYINSEERVNPTIVENEGNKPEENTINQELSFNPFDTQKPVNLDSAKADQPKVNVKPKPTPPKNIPTTPPPAVNTNIHYAVVGVFSTPENAEKMAEKIRAKGLKPFKKQLSSDRFRVSVEINAKKDELDAKLQEVKKYFPDAWLIQ